MQRWLEEREPLRYWIQYLRGRGRRALFYREPFGIALESLENRLLRPTESKPKYPKAHTVVTAPEVPLASDPPIPLGRIPTESQRVDDSAATMYNQP